MAIPGLKIRRRAEAAATALSTFARFFWVLIAERGKNGRWRLKGPFKRDYSYTLFLLLLLWVVDPVGMASNSARSSAELFYRVMSPSYPQPDDASVTEDSSEGPPRIAVIVINDKTLQAFDKPWPPPLSFHAKVLEKILGESAPKAVFVDFGFFNERDSDEVESLAATLRSHALPIGAFLRSADLWGKEEASRSDNTAEGFTPVFLAAAPGGLSVLKDLKNAVTGTVSTRYAMSHESPYNTYALFDCDTRKPSDSKKPSAALAMYAVEHSDWRNWDLTRCPENEFWEGGRNKMSIFWASWGSKTEGRGIYPCHSLPTTPMGRIGQIVKIWFFGLMGRSDAWSDQFQTCPPHLALSAHEILKDEGGGYAALLVDRYVLYGGNFAMAGDLIEAPTHGPMPGVFMHAMALDNLLREDPYVHLAPGSGLTSGPTWLTLAVAIIVVFFIVLAWNGSAKIWAAKETEGASREGPAQANGSSRTRRTNAEVFPTDDQIKAGLWWGAFMTLSVVSVIFAVWLAFSVFQWAPINFIGLLTFVVLDAAAKTVGHLTVSIFS